MDADSLKKQRQLNPLYIFNKEGYIIGKRIMKMKNYKLIRPFKYGKQSRGEGSVL
jgi:hypothetical protein